ncbi:MAG: 4-hydroxy-tetrahydrodipicolinate synthase [Ruminococcaceae bacterium]|nr:4-hydroxy-tetrahydrodipicolinate synthase [Oscillospiraceae bacterium]
MKNTIFEGVATALVTPMNEDGSINFDRLKTLIDEQIQAGIPALVICGTTGESATMTLEEHSKVIRFAIECAKGRVKIIAGAGSNDTACAADLAKEAEEAGADALLIVTPYYNKATQNGLVAHYKYIAERVSLPIILYNVPSRTGVNIKPETYAKLADIDNIVAIKEANGDISSVVKTRLLCGDKLDIYSGNDDQIVPIMALGGKGVISVLSNVMPKETVELCDKMLNGDLEGAAAMQIELSSLIDALFIEVNPIPCKEAMNLMGMNMGPVRLPMTPMEESTKAVLIKELKKFDLI